MSEPIDWQDAPSTATPITAANLKAHDAWMVAQVEAAQSSANAAAASADEAAAPADDQVAALVADAGSGTRAQLAPLLSAAVADAGAYTDAEILGLQAQSASIEDLFHTVTLQTQNGTWTNSADESSPLMAAPFPLTITSISLLWWKGAAIALSDTSFWRIVVRKRMLSGATPDVAKKTTRLTADATYPAGQVWTPRVPWTFDSAAFVGATLQAGETLYLATLPVGTPTAISGPLTATIGYRPL